MSSPARPMHRWVLATALLLLPLAGWAHKPSDSYLRLRVEHHGLEGRWDIALRDLEYALGLDADHDGLITWGELRVRHADIAAYALARFEQPNTRSRTTAMAPTWCWALTPIVPKPTCPSL